MAPPGIITLPRDFLLAQGPLHGQTLLELRQDHGSSTKLVLSCEANKGMLMIMNKVKVVARGGALSWNSLWSSARIPNNPHIGWLSMGSSSSVVTSRSVTVASLHDRWKLWVSGHH
jgi:hypothetical protein